MKALSTFLIFFFHQSQTARLLRRELEGYSLAKCNDGTTASYFYDQDIRAAGSKVLVYLPDSGHCSSVDQCQTRCSAASPDRQTCTGPSHTVLELSEGIWSEAEDNPFSDHFKVYIHSCSNDDFSGTRSASRLTSDLYFHGHHILTSVLQDLVATFGINKADSVVLAGSGTGARGVGYNCDYVSEALRSVNSRADVRCVLDAPDFVPWWVRTEADKCKGRDINSLEQEAVLWGKEADQSCMEAARASDNITGAEVFHKCGVFSRYWEHIDTPFFLINSQYNPVYFEAAPCGPETSDPQYAAYQLSWRRGVLALMEAMLARRRTDLGVFSANCDSHSLLSGLLARPYWSSLSVPKFEDNSTSASLNELLFQWRLSDTSQAIDSLMRNNSQCVSAAPHRLHSSCMGRLITCDARASLLPSVASVSRRGGRGWRRGLIRRLSPPSYLWPASYDQHRRCGLDPFYSGCGNVNLIGSGCGTCRPVCTGSCHQGAGGSFLSSGGDRVVPESALPAAGSKGRLWRRFYYLQYLKLLYNKLKKEYAREYYRHAGHGYGLSGIHGLKGFSSIKAPSVGVRDHDYGDYYDDGDYYDYDYPADDLFARIVKAVKKNKKENPAPRRNDPSKILLSSVQEDFVFPQELLDSLPDIDDLDYEDFESLNAQVESINTVRKKKNLSS